MKRLLTLTLFGLLAISCTRGNHGFIITSKDSSMTNSVGTQAELDAAESKNKRIQAGAVAARISRSIDVLHRYDLVLSPTQKKNTFSKGAIET